MFAKKKREQHMMVKGKDRKRVLMLSVSVGAYILAYLYLFLCWKMQATDDVTAWGFFLFTFVGVVCAYICVTLPAPELSPECLEELKRMIEDMENEL